MPKESFFFFFSPFSFPESSPGVSGVFSFFRGLPSGDVKFLRFAEGFSARNFSQTHKCERAKNTFKLSDMQKNIPGVNYLVWIKKKVTEFAGQVKLFHQFILNNPGGALPHTQSQGIVSDEVAHDLLGWRALCSVKTVCWDITDHL